MTEAFDALDEAALRRRVTLKWARYPEQVLPLWVADMDFPVAAPIREAICAFAASGDLGYPPRDGLPGLREAVAERLTGRHGLRVAAEHVMPLPGVIPGLHLACLALAGPGDGVVIQTPAYPPFMDAVERTGRRVVFNRLLETEAGWRMDLAGLEGAISPATRVLLLCNPHNPTGRMFSRAELERLAAVALRHRLWIVSDELHADLALSGHHIPMASLGDEVAARTLTLCGPTKAFNIAGLRAGFAVSHNTQLLERLQELAEGLVPACNSLAQVATLAAYREAGPWLDEVLEYLRGNLETLRRFVDEELPGVRLSPPEGTYLAWLDFREALAGEPLEPFLLQRAGLALSPGDSYGPGGEGFARLNFATSRRVLTTALERLGDALRAAA